MVGLDEGEVFGSSVFGLNIPQSHVIVFPISLINSGERRLKGNCTTTV